MFLRPGEAVCDKCGNPLGSGEIAQAIVTSDIDPHGHVETLHFCRENNCNKKVLSDANIKFRKEHLAKIKDGDAG